MKSFLSRSGKSYPCSPAKYPMYVNLDALDWGKAVALDPTKCVLARAAIRSDPAIQEAWVGSGTRAVFLFKDGTAKEFAMLTHARRVVDALDMGDKSKFFSQTVRFDPPFVPKITKGKKKKKSVHAAHKSTVTRMSRMARLGIPNRLPPLFDIS